MIVVRGSAQVHAGSSRVPRRRVLVKSGKLRDGTHTDPPFQVVFNQFGEGRLVFAVVECAELRVRAHTNRLAQTLVPDQPPLTV